ncbi:cGMP-dependent protein kinase, isozyme 1-like [Brevipalpus obovatus]|uniref:cGMP-dependent protein kinase, isozyme 1-like n=1 Tax=Brevipalpus obovatus TaxID=246614 RepID=UPI003D9EB725
MNSSRKNSSSKSFTRLCRAPSSPPPNQISPPPISPLANRIMNVLVPRAIIITPPSESTTPENSTSSPPPPPSPPEANDTSPAIVQGCEHLVDGKVKSKSSGATGSHGASDGEHGREKRKSSVSSRLDRIKRSLRSKVKPYWKRSKSKQIGISDNNNNNNNNGERNTRSFSEELDVDVLHRIDLHPRILRTGSFDNLTTLIWASKRLTSTRSVRRKFRRILIAFKQLTQTSRASTLSNENITSSPNVDTIDKSIDPSGSHHHHHHHHDPFAQQQHQSSTNCHTLARSDNILNTHTQSGDHDSSPSPINIEGEEECRFTFDSQYRPSGECDSIISSRGEMDSEMMQSEDTGSDNQLSAVHPKRLFVSLNDLSDYRSSEETSSSDIDLSSRDQTFRGNAITSSDNGDSNRPGLMHRTLTLARISWQTHCSKKVKKSFTNKLSNLMANNNRRSKIGQNSVSRLEKSDSKESKSDSEKAKEELASVKRELFEKDQQLLKLNREMHKLKCVLKQCQEYIASPGMLGTPTIQSPPVKKCGVSGGSFPHFDTFTIDKIKKDSRTDALIRNALLDNTFLQNSLDSHQLKLIVGAMYGKEYEKGDILCEQGAFGMNLYVTAHGFCQVIVDGEPMGTIDSGKVIGELAILYNCARTATVKALTKVRVWVLDRRTFQTIMVNTSQDRRRQYNSFLRRVPLLQTLNEDLISKIVDAIEVEIFPASEYICRQGCHGDSFYIISRGSVRITQEITNHAQEVEEILINILGKGDYFGERALFSGGSLRTANVISEECECLVLDRTSFFSLVGDLSELRDKRYRNQNEQMISQQSISHKESTEAENLDKLLYDNLSLDQLELITTLGIGGFGRVDLVRVKSDPNQVYALKSCSKMFIRSTQQQDHINNERIVQKIASRHQFIVKLYRTFKDETHVYFLMESAIGGELWTLLKKTGPFDESTSRFYIGCVVEALQYLHSQHIIYRDLKPENCLLDCGGYLKLTDFGFSKILEPGQRTWTFCGTPEYVAPEIILNRGHDKAVDFWSIGILLYELLTGLPPFQSADPLKTYNIILRGFEEIVFDEKIFSKNAINLIRRLCKENPSERIGVQKNGFHDLKRHKWFAGFDWGALVRRAIKPPIIPILNGPTDTRYFDLSSSDITLRNHFDRDFFPSEDCLDDDGPDDWDCEF